MDGDRRTRTETTRAALALVTLIAFYALQVWAANDYSSHLGQPHIKHSILMVVSGVLQGAALLVLYRAFKRGARPNRWVLVASIAALLIASAMCADTNIDASAYIGYAKLATFGQAYHASTPSFSGNGFDVIRLHWPELPPLVYGPLWLALDRLLLSDAPTFAAALGILRAFNALCLLGLLVAVRQLGLDRATVAVIALNPMLYFYFVVQAHNDLLPILLVVAGTVIAARRPLLGAMIAGAAGLIKITFVALAPLAYARPRAPRVTLAYLALSLVVTAAISTAFGGIDYVHAMMSVGHMQVAARNDALHTVGLLLHALLALVAALALAWAILRGSFVAPASYSFSAISTIVYPWYLGWCIPYALRTPKFAPSFFILLPGVAHAIDPDFALYPAHQFATLDPYYAVVIALVVRHVWLVNRNRRLPAPNP